MKEQGRWQDVRRNVCCSSSPSTRFIRLAMISKRQIKYIQGLQQKKHRQQEGVFVAEGPKVVGDLMEGLDARMVVATREWMSQHAVPAQTEFIEVSEEELRRVSFLQHPQQVLALFPIPDATCALPSAGTLSLALDGVQDPGNLGTIIRIADWFGIETIYCSEDTADAYNPKVVQATMGSIARVHIVYTDLVSLIEQLPLDTPVYGTLLDGEDIYKQHLSNHGLVIMGNEGNGISQAVAEKVNRRLFIPPFPQDRHTADSLNVAIATAIVCAELRKNHQ